MPTQTEIAADLGLSQPAISGALAALGLMKAEYEKMPLEEIRRVIMRHYAEIAAGRGGLEQFSLAQERARESRLKGDLLQLQIQEKSGTLIPAAAIEASWIALVLACKTELLMIPDKLVSAMKSLYGIDVDPDIFERPINDALERLSRTGDESA